MTTDAQAALAQVREALAAGPTPREWLIAGEDKSFVYSLGPHGTNAFWAHVQAAGPERISEAEKGANAKLIAACSPENIAALLAEIDRLREQLSTALMDGHDMAKNEYRDEIERLTALLADRDEREAKIARERDEARAERDAMANVLPGHYYMDPPDGGDVPVLEQLRRMAKDAERYRFLSCKGVPPYFHRCSRWRLEYWNGEWWDPLMKEELDAAIDAQIEQERSEQAKEGA